MRAILVLLPLLLVACAPQRALTPGEARYEMIRQHCDDVAEVSAQHRSEDDPAEYYSSYADCHIIHAR